MSESLNSVTSSSLRELSTPVTFLRLISSVLIWSSRAARLTERSETPLMAPRNSSGVSAEISPRVLSASDSCGTSIPSVVLLRSENACTTSYGRDRPRRAGSSQPLGSWPGPLGVSARYSAPSSVRTRMSAPVSVPNLVPLSILNVTRTLLPASSMSSTLPTETPATAHLVAGLERADLGEVGVVGVAAADDRQPVGAEGAEHHQRDHGDADDPDDDGLRSRNGFIGCTPAGCIVRRRRRGLVAREVELGLGQDHRVADLDLGDRDAALDLAQVEVELAARRSGVADLAS